MISDKLKVPDFLRLRKVDLEFGPRSSVDVPVCENFGFGLWTTEMVELFFEKIFYGLLNYQKS